MPEIGEIKRGREIGRTASPSQNYIWFACDICGKQRWVQYIRGMPVHRMCSYCSGKQAGIKHKGQKRQRSGNWKGGRIIDEKGYKQIYIGADDFFSPMAKSNGYVREHRLVIAKALGRCLWPWEIVHHKNGIRDDNRRSNLTLTTLGSHTIEHSKGYRDGYREGYQDGQSKAMEELKQQIRLLRWQLKERKNADL